jgi:hypothetical protein
MAISKKEIAGLADAIREVASKPGADRTTAFAIIQSINNYLWETHGDPKGFDNAAKGLIDLSGWNYIRELDYHGEKHISKVIT